MTAPVNFVTPYYWPGDAITCEAMVAVKGMQFVDVVATLESGPGLSATAEGGNIVIGLCTVGEKGFGVAIHDAAAGTKVGVYRGSGLILPVVNTGGVTAGDYLQIASTAGLVQTRTGTSVIIGQALNTVATALPVMVALH